MSAMAAAAFAGLALGLAFVGLTMYVRAPVPPRAADLLAERRQGSRGDALGVIDSSPVGKLVARDLDRAAMSQRPASFILLTATLLAGGLVVLPAFFGDPGVIFALVAAAIPYLVVRRRAGRHAREFKRQLPAVLDLLASALRAGQSEMQAFALAGNEMPGAAGEEFRRMHEELQLGATVDSVTSALLVRLPDPDLELAVDAIQLSHRVGGNLAEMLGQISGTIRDRVRLGAEIRALTAQARASVYLVTALAPIGLFFISLVNPEWGTLLFETTGGRIALGIAFTLELIGFLTARSVSRVNV